MSDKDGGPAFPWGESGLRLGGMSLRDYFAANALPAIIVATSAGQHMPRGDGEMRDRISRDAYEMADSMLLARADGIKNEG